MCEERPLLAEGGDRRKEEGVNRMKKDSGTRERMAVSNGRLDQRKGLCGYTLDRLTAGEGDGWRTGGGLTLWTSMEVGWRDARTF